MEWNLRAANAPYVVKSPSLCTELETILLGGKVMIEHVLIPVRDLFSAAESRRDVSRRTRRYMQGPVPGGLWDVHQPQDQEAVLAQKLNDLFVTLATWDIPHTLLAFPRIVSDPVYLFSKLQPRLGDCSYAKFEAAFSLIAKPQLVHQFADAATFRKCAVG